MNSPLVPSQLLTRQALWDLSAQVAGVGTYVLHLPSNDLEVDDRLLELSELTRATFSGRPEDVYAHLHPDDVDDVVAAVQHATTTGGNYHAEYRVVLPGGGHRWVSARGKVLTDEHGTPTALVGAAYDVTEAREAVAATVAVLETMAVGYLAMDPDWVITHLNAAAERVAAAPRADLVGRDFWEAFPLTLGTEFERGYRHAVATGETVSLDAFYPEPLNVWVEVRAVPQRGGLALYFIDITARHDAEHALDLALVRQQEVAQAQRELVGLARALGETDTEADVLDVVTRAAVAIWGIRGSALSLPTPDGASVRSLSASYTDLVLATFDLLPAEHPLPAVRTAVTGTAHYLPDLATTAARFPGCEHIYRAGGIESSAAVPLRAQGRLLGSFSLGFSEAHTWSPGERELLEAFAALTAQALDRLGARDAERAARKAERAANDAERAASAEVARFSETLQRSLLTAPPEPDHLQIAVRYAPATAAAYVGGDWYDAFMTGEGMTCLVIGDVAGHDRRAAAAMSAMRNTLRGIGYTIGQPPAQVLTVLDRAVHDLGIEAVSTIVLAQVEQDEAHRAAGTRLLRWSNAGHPAPLLIQADGAVRFLGADRLDAHAATDLVIGIDPSTDRRDHGVVLEPGATVLLYTDGLIERRGAALDEGMAWLAEAASELVARPGGTLDDLCDGLLAAIGDVEDDVALLALRAHPEDQPRPVEAGPTRVPLAEPTLSNEEPENSRDAAPPEA